jgi:hypothetical protein
MGNRPDRVPPVNGKSPGGSLAGQFRPDGFLPEDDRLRISGESTIVPLSGPVFKPNRQSRGRPRQSRLQPEKPLKS